MHLIIKLVKNMQLIQKFLYRHMMEALLKSVRCEIIAFSRNDQIDAYVLR